MKYDMPEFSYVKARKLVAAVQALELQAQNYGFLRSFKAINDAKNTIGWEFTHKAKEFEKTQNNTNARRSPN